MSRRASVFARNNPGKWRVRFPDEVVFEEFVKEQDGEAVMAMLRRVSIDIDVNRINMAGMTALHQAVLDNNLKVVRLLLNHGANVNCIDEDSWSPLHAASANGHHQIAKYLIEHGANIQAVTDAGETPIDLVDPADAITNAIFKEVRAEPKTQIKDKKKSFQDGRRTPEWAREEKESAQESIISKGDAVLSSFLEKRRNNSLGIFLERKDPLLETISEAKCPDQNKTVFSSVVPRKDSILDSIPDCNWEIKTRVYNPVEKCEGPSQKSSLERRIQLWEEKKLSLGVDRQFPRFEEEMETDSEKVATKEDSSEKEKAKEGLRDVWEGRKLGSGRGRREGRLEHVSGSPASEPINRLREKKR